MLKLGILFFIVSNTKSFISNRKIKKIKYLHGSNSIEQIKEDSEYLRKPLKDEINNIETLKISNDAYTILKYHGSYQQFDKDLMKDKRIKEWSFMLRLKNPGGEIPNSLYKLVDSLSTKYGIDNIRLTTRQAFQIHGICKGDLKQVIKEISLSGSSTIGACGDVSRNVMCTPAPFEDNPAYQYALLYSKLLSQLFKPQTPAFSEILDDEKNKVCTMEYWNNELEEKGFNVNKLIRNSDGNNILTNDITEPLYGSKYLPKKFKIGITVPTDNSLDLFTNDIGLIVIIDKYENLLGFNVLVGGGMGRSHNKETTFARVADKLGFVPKEDVVLLMKSILATQRDHGNREVRANARMKYLVDSLGVNNFKILVESYFEKKIKPWRDIPEWKLKDWMGLYPQNIGNSRWFLGINVPQGRIIDDGKVNYKTAFRKIVDIYSHIDVVLTPSQSIIFKNIKKNDIKDIRQILNHNNIQFIESVDNITRYSMACPALPLCGLAITEAERYMKNLAKIILDILIFHNLSHEKIVVRMTGCPNGCARPYMAELALVGDGKNSYQIWVGGSQTLERVGYILLEKIKWGVHLENTLNNLVEQWKLGRHNSESFGDYWIRKKN